MTNAERKLLKQEYENLKLLIEFHSVRQVIQHPVELQQMINDILDRMNDIKRRLETK